MLKVRQAKSGTKGHGYEKNNLKKRKKRERKRNTTKSLENETRKVKARLQHCYYTKLLYVSSVIQTYKKIKKLKSTGTETLQRSSREINILQKSQQ